MDDALKTKISARLKALEAVVVAARGLQEFWLLVDSENATLEPNSQSFHALWEALAAVDALSEPKDPTLLVNVLDEDSDG